MLEFGKKRKLVIKVHQIFTTHADQDDDDNITRFLILVREPIIPGTDRPHKVLFFVTQPFVIFFFFLFFLILEY